MLKIYSGTYNDEISTFGKYLPYFILQCNFGVSRSREDFKNNRLKSPQSLNNVDNVNYL